MDPLIPVLAALIVALLVTALWTVTVLFVCWDVYRSALSARQQLGWAAFSLVPFIGFAYYLARRRQWTAPDEPAERETMLKPPGICRPPAVEAVSPWAAASKENSPVAAADLASLCLYAATGPHEGRQFAIPSLPALIGRDTTAAILLDQDPSASRQHAELYEREGELWLRDLGSTHCTLVNDSLIADQALVLGDTVGVGQTRLLLGNKADDEP